MDSTGLVVRDLGSEGWILRWATNQTHRSHESFASNKFRGAQIEARRGIDVGDAKKNK